MEKAIKILIAAARAVVDENDEDTGKMGDFMCGLHEATCDAEQLLKATEPAENALLETVFDLAQHWQAKATDYTHFNSGNSVPEDSREIARLTIEWAKEFEADFQQTYNPKRDYMEEVEVFFNQKYAEWLAGTEVPDETIQTRGTK
jgi:hypothetical protein